jgi:acetyl esterase/lipase
MSPLDRISADAPPFFVVQGRNDTLVDVQVARDFVDRVPRRRDGTDLLRGVAFHTARL